MFAECEFGVNPIVVEELHQDLKLYLQQVRVIEIISELELQIPLDAIYTLRKNIEKIDFSHALLNSQLKA